MIEQGTAGLIWQSPSFVAGPFGFEKTIKATGNHADCLAIVTTYQASGWRVSVQPIEGTPKSTFTATIGNLDPASPDTNLVTTWELDVQWALHELKSSKRFLDRLAALANDAARATEVITLQAAADEMRTTHTDTLFTALTSDQKPWAIDLANDATQWEPSAVLRRTNVYSALTTWVNDWSDANKVWSKTQIDALTSAPSAIIGTLPTGSYWLQTPAGMSYDNAGRITVTTHWVYGTYPSHRYTYKT